MQQERLPLSVTIITLNEESNIELAIQSVSWAEEIIVVDSGSSDKTQEIAQKMGAKVLFNSWRGYGQQKNFAQDQASHDWVLNIDADERVTPELAAEIQEVLKALKTSPEAYAGLSFPRRTYYMGRWIKYGGWYPNILVRMSHRKKSRWTEPFVHEELEAKGPVLSLKNPLDHFAFSSIQEQILTNLRFSKLGSQDLSRSGRSVSLFHLVLKPLGKFFETYFIKLGLLDGVAGFIISINAAHSMFLKYAYLFENRIKLSRK